MRKFYRSLIAATFSLAAFASPVAAQTANGKATTAAPVYPNNQAAPLSLDTAGNLRVNCITGCSGGGGGGGTSSNFGVAFPAAGTAAGFISSGGNMAGASLSASGNLRTTLLEALPAGTNNIGDVDVLTLPSIPAGANAIGTVGVTTLPAIPAGSNTIGTVIAVGDVANDAPDSGNPVKIGGIANSTPPTAVAVGDRANAWLGLNGQQMIGVLGGNVTDAQANTLIGTIPRAVDGDGSILRTATTVFNGTSWDRQRGDVGGTWVTPSAAPATLNFSAILAASTNATLVKNTPGAIQEISVYNSGSTIAWLKLYDASSAPTCGSGTPVGRYLIPGAASGGAGSNVNISLGKGFATGIAFCVTTGIADADTAAVAAATYTVNLTYR